MSNTADQKSFPSGPLVISPDQSRRFRQRLRNKISHYFHPQPSQPVALNQDPTQDHNGASEPSPPLLRNTTLGSSEQYVHFECGHSIHVPEGPQRLRDRLRRLLGKKQPVIILIKSRCPDCKSPSSAPHKSKMKEILAVLGEAPYDPVEIARAEKVARAVSEDSFDSKREELIVQHVATEMEKEQKLEEEQEMQEEKEKRKAEKKAERRRKRAAKRAALPDYVTVRGCSDT